MLKLMKLEMKKHNLSGYIRGAFIANIIILAFLCLIGYGTKLDGDIPFTSAAMFLDLTETFIRGTFIVFASVLIGRFIIGEYLNKTITVLFMYPIPRKKLLTAKMLVVSSFTLIAILLSNVIVVSVFLLFNYFTNILPEPVTVNDVTEYVVHMVINAVTASGISLIPLFFGMRKKSISAAIVSSIFLVILVCSNNMGFSLNSILIIPATMALIGIFFAYQAIRNVDHTDIT